MVKSLKIGDYSNAQDDTQGNLHFKDFGSDLQVVSCIASFSSRDKFLYFYNED
jgi:hypothetical protein